MERLQVVLRIENYKGLIAAKAIKYWHKLPPSSKAWIDVEDFITDGMVYARSDVLPYYDIRTGNSFTTLLTIMIEQFYIRKLRDTFRQKRSPVDLPESEKSFDPSDTIVSRLSLQKLYDNASPELKASLKVWFYSKRGPIGIRTNTRSFKSAKKEFVKLSKRYGLDVNACRTVLERRPV